MELICPICNKTYFKKTGHYNRAIKLGAKLYCSKDCFSIGRKLQSDKHLKTPDQLKAEKAEYDRQYRQKNSETIKIRKAEAFKKDYTANPEKYREQRQKRMPYHVKYCRKPDQREKERLRNRKKNGLTEIKNCLCCSYDKQKIEFESYLIFPDKRHYMCKSCEEKDFKELNITTREVLATIRTSLIKSKSILTVKDIAQHPYLIEANKYLLLLKRLTK